MKSNYDDTQQFINDIHEEISIKDTIIKMGIIQQNEFKGQFTRCIFHDKDNTPSLQITDNFWKCYACGAKGDLIAFIQQYYNTDFIEALKSIADFLNVNISNIKLNFNGKADKLKEEWNNYLNEMSKAPKEIKDLKRDYFPQEIGYDKNINYVVLPLTSKTGAILGFTKRKVDNEAQGPKWRHSSLKDSMMDLCHNIFNLHGASPEIKKKQSVIITEGPKDVIAYQRINLKNTICVCGVNNSTNIWDLILPVKEIVLSMDGDNAGQKAVLQIVEYLSSMFDIKNIYAVELPDGEDPYSVNDLQKYYDNKVLAIEYVIKYGDLEIISNIYNKVLDYNKFFIIKSICKVKKFSILETESWLNSSNFNNDTEIKKLSEKENLLAIIECRDVENVKYIPIDKAKRILELKYGIK